MPIPSFEMIMRPLLTYLNDGQPRNTTETLDALAKTLGVTQAEREQLLPSGTQALFTNRVSWAKAYLNKALCISKPRRGIYQITERGRRLLVDVGEEQVRMETLKKFAEFREFLQGRVSGAQDTTTRDDSGGRPTSSSEAESPELTPEELIEIGYSQLDAQLQSEVGSVS